MPRTALAITDIALGAAAQLTGAGADQANGMNFPNAGDLLLVIYNGDGATRTVTVASVPQAPLGRIGDIVRAITTLGIGVVGPLRPDAFNQSDGTVNVDFSAGTTSAVKVTVLRMHA